MKKKNFIPFPRSGKIIAGLAMLLLTVILFLVPKDVRADGYGSANVYTYEDLVKASQDPTVHSIYLQPKEDFGWPSSPAELTVTARMYLDVPWYIPKNVTLHMSSGFGFYMPNPVTLAGKVNFESLASYNGEYNAGNMIIESGGELAISQNCHDVSAINLTVKKGASLNVNGNLTIFNQNGNSVFTLDEGAIVNASMGRISISENGTIKSNKGKINGTISIRAETTRTQKFLDGTLTVDVFKISKNVSLPSKSTLNVMRELFLTSGRTDHPAPTFTIENGAVLNLKNYMNVNSGCIKVKKGGIVNAKSLELRNTMIDGKIQGGSSMILDSGAVLNIDQSLYLDTKASVKGYGTITFSGPKFITGESRIAKTIKIKSNGSSSGNGSTPTPGEDLPKGTIIRSGNKKYKITATGKSRAVEFLNTTATGAVDIPSKLMINSNAYPVKAIAAKAFFQNKKITSVNVPSSVTTIGTNAFYGASRLKKVTGMTGVSTVGKNAFNSCVSLTQIGNKAGTITLSKVKKIDINAFRSCRKIKAVNLESKYLTSIGVNAFYKAGSVKNINIKTTKLKTIGTNAVTGINSKAVIKVPASHVSAYKKLFTSKTGYKKTMKITK